MIFFRSLAFNLLFFTISIFIGFFLFPFLISSSLTIKISHKWALITIYLLKKICKIEIEINKKNLNKYFNNQVLFAVRHESVLETILFLAYFSNIKYIVKKELLYVPFYGQFVWRCGHIIIDRKEQSKTIFLMLKKIKLLLTKKENLVLFPHGTRVKYRAKVNIKPGIYAIYKHLKIPIIPVYMASGHVWDKKGFIKNPGIVKVTFFDSIESGYSKEKFLRLLNSKLN